eukprot:10861516-Alexandrium_andersonii.AAC.1
MGAQSVFGVLNAVLTMTVPKLRAGRAPCHCHCRCSCLSVLTAPVAAGAVCMWYLVVVVVRAVAMDTTE